MGVASSARMFFQQIGGSLGVAALGALFASRLNSALSGAGGSFHASGGQLDPATVNNLRPSVRHAVDYAIAHAVQGVFIWVIPASVIVFALALFIKEVPLRGRAPGAENLAPEPELVG